MDETGETGIVPNFPAGVFRRLGVDFDRQYLERGIDLRGTAV